MCIRTYLLILIFKKNPVYIYIYGLTTQNKKDIIKIVIPPLYVLIKLIETFFYILGCFSVCQKVQEIF